MNSADRVAGHEGANIPSEPRRTRWALPVLAGLLVVLGASYFGFGAIIGRDDAQPRIERQSPFATTTIPKNP